MFFKYLRYLFIHKWWVFYYCCKQGIPFRGLIHDWSKFLPSEFFPYMRLFYGNYPSISEVHGDRRNFVSRYKEDVEVDADKSWLLHQRRNKHHWQYWVLTEDSGKVIPIEMPDKYLKEMVCDWKGAGMAINGKDDTMKWYEKNKEFMNLHPLTQLKVELLLIDMELKEKYAKA